MNRIEFTKSIVGLLSKMVELWEPVIIDYCKRSDQEQHRLFLDGLSKCDGVHKISRHQEGKALDIYFVDKGKLVNPKMGHEYWHKVWQEEFGGQPMILWDKGHYE